MNEQIKEILSKILQLSNIDYCESSGDMQDKLEQINDLISSNLPEIKEYED